MKCDKFNGWLTCVPKPWMSDSETPVAEPGAHPRYNTCAYEWNGDSKDGGIRGSVSITA